MYEKFLPKFHKMHKNPSLSSRNNLTIVFIRVEHTKKSIIKTETVDNAVDITTMDSYLICPENKHYVKFETFVVFIHPLWYLYRKYLFISFN